MARRVLFLLAAAVAVAGAIARRRRRGGPEPNGGRARTEQLRREIEAARARLRESIQTRDS